jgi:thiol-disulfide isomerase/thioredoxin
MVGKPAPTLGGDYWLNDNAKPYADGVTMIIFTANWCHSCRESYPTVEKLSTDLKGKGLQTVLAVSLDGVFEGVQMANPDQEVAANKTYFVEKHKFGYPIAIQNPAVHKASDGESQDSTANSMKFHLRGLPQFIVVDKKGVVRAVLVGWDPYGNRGRALGAVLEQLVNS